MNPHAAGYPALDDSLHNAFRTLDTAEDILDTILLSLANEGSASASTAIPTTSGSLLGIADRVAQRADGVVNKLQRLRDLISAPKVEKFAGVQKNYANEHAYGVSGSGGASGYGSELPGRAG